MATARFADAGPAFPEIDFPDPDDTETARRLAAQDDETDARRDFLIAAMGNGQVADYRPLPRLIQE